MKNFFKSHVAPLFGIVLILMIGFSIIACSDDDEEDQSWKAAAKNAFQRAKFAPTFSEIMPNSVKATTGRVATQATQQDFDQMIGMFDERTQIMAQRKSEVLIAIERLTATGVWQNFTSTSITGNQHTVSYRLDVNANGSRSVGVKDSNWTSGGWSAVLSADEQTLEVITNYTRVVSQIGGQVTVISKYYSSYNGVIFIEMEYENDGSRETVQYAEYKKNAGVYTGEHTRIDKQQSTYECNLNLEKGDNANYLHLHSYLQNDGNVSITIYLGNESAFNIDPDNFKLSGIPALADTVISYSNLADVFTKINAYLATKL